MDVKRGLISTSPPANDGGGKSIWAVSREFGLQRDAVRKMLAYSVPLGYRRQTPSRRPKLQPFTGVTDPILAGLYAKCRKSFKAC